MFGKQLLPAALFCAPTVEQLAAQLKQDQTQQNLTSLLPIQPYGSKAPFFWVHGDHSNALLPRFLPPEQPVYGLEHQSADGNPARFRRVDAIAAHYLNEVRAVQRRGPYYIGGYSFGAVVACEMVTQLAKLGEDVGLLALLDPPGAVYHRTFARIRAFFDDLSRAPKSPLGNRAHSGPRKSLPLDERCRYAFAGSRGKVLLAISEIRDAVAELRNRMLCLGAIAMKRPIPHSLRSFYILNVYHRARLKHQTLPYSGNALIFASEHRSQEHFNYWKGLILGNIEYCRLPGDHDAARREPAAVRVWAEKLRDRLSEAQANFRMATDLGGKD